MKNMCLQLLVLFSSFTAMADASGSVDPRTLPAIRLIEIQAEYYPGEVYYLGYAENPDHTIHSIFYENDKHERRFYTFKQLDQYVTIIKSTKGETVYDLVRLMVRPGEVKGTYDATLRYMKNGLFKNSGYAEFSMIYNSRRQIYELIGDDADHLINRAFVTTNYWGSMAVGIDEIKTQ